MAKRSPDQPGQRKRRGWPRNFLERQDPQSDGCIWYSGPLTRIGYGQPVRTDDGRDIAPHVAAYEWFVGPVPDGYELDHLCHDPEVCRLGNDCTHRRCMNYEHLEPVDRNENMRRARRKTCSKGHPLTPDNVYRKKDGRESCRTCWNERERRYYYKRLGRDVPD